MPSKEKKTVQKASGESKPSVKTVTVSQEQREEVESQLQADGYQIMSAKTAGDKVTITAKCFDPPKRAHREFED